MVGGAIEAGLALALVGLPSVAALLAVLVAAALLAAKGNAASPALVCAGCFAIAPSLFVVVLAVPDQARALATLGAAFGCAALLFAGNAVASAAVPPGTLGRVSAPLLYLGGLFTLLGIALAGSALVAMGLPGWEGRVVSSVLFVVWAGWSGTSGAVMLLVGAVRLSRPEDP